MGRNDIIKARANDFYNRAQKLIGKDDGSIVYAYLVDATNIIHDLLISSFTKEDLRILYRALNDRMEVLHNKHSKRTKEEQSEFRHSLDLRRSIEDMIGPQEISIVHESIRQETSKKKLKLYNGRWGRNGLDRAYVAAYSKTDCLRVVADLYGERRLTLSELNVYWSAGSWGVNMDGITPERGMWIKKRDDHPDDYQPVRITSENAKDFK